MSEHEYSLTNARLGRRLQKLRHAIRWSTEQLATAATPYLAGAPQDRQGEVNRFAVSRIESGRRVLKYSEAVAFAKALGVPTEAFISDEAAEAHAARLAEEVSA